MKFQECIEKAGIMVKFRRHDHKEFYFFALSMINDGFVMFDQYSRPCSMPLDYEDLIADDWELMR